MEERVMIGIAELRSSVDPTQTLEDRLKSTMHKALHHWLVTDEESQLRMAVGAVMVEATAEERDRLERELRFLRGLSVAASGIPVDLGATLSDLADENKEKPVGLKNLWDEVKAEGH